MKYYCKQRENQIQYFDAKIVDIDRYRLYYSKSEFNKQHYFFTTNLIELYINQDYLSHIQSQVLSNWIRELFKDNFSCFFKWFHYYRVMNEQSKRNSTRLKKPPRYLQQEQIEYGIYGGPHPTDTKEMRSNLVETNQIAKLLVKLLQTSNQKLRDYQLNEMTDEPFGKQKMLGDNYKNRDELNKNSDRKNGCQASQLNKKVKDINERSVNENYKTTNKDNEKKYMLAGKGGSNVSKEISLDQSYMAMLSQHIISNLQYSNGPPADILMQLESPKQFKEQQVKKQIDKAEKNKKKKEITVQSINGGRKDTKDQLKPFKRQSYHVAISYYIHLKQVKAVNPNSKNIDPTSNARKLREQSGQQQ